MLASYWKKVYLLFKTFIKIPYEPSVALSNSIFWVKIWERAKHQECFYLQVFLGATVNAKTSKVLENLRL